MILYHGSQNDNVIPCYGLGKDHHDFGKGFYLTDSLELAKEWSVSCPESHDGWIHTFNVDFEGLNVFDFREVNVLSWIAELMKHRAADESVLYKRRSTKFIEKFGVDTGNSDIIVGWRADASYFYIVKAFVRGDIDVECLPTLLNLGNFGIQYVIKTPLAYSHLHSLPDQKQNVTFDVYHVAYDNRDVVARKRMYELISDPTFNKLEHLFIDLIR